MIHKYLRSVGFSAYTARPQIQQLVSEAIRNADFRLPAKRKDGTTMCMFVKSYAPDTGLAICGEYDEDGHFLFDYYFPYLSGNGISTAEEISVERQAAQVSYAGIVDEARVGVSLIFYVSNMMDYLRMSAEKSDPLHGATLTLAALSDGGTVMLPIHKTGADRAFSRKKSVDRYRLISAAKRGNEAAIETLTLEDMDTYTAVSKKIKESDVFTLVDTYFMPFGVECDQYSVLGEITACIRIENDRTGEGLYVMKLLCNDIYFDVCINEKDLTGEPKTGRRFKGNVWMQGRINFVK